MNTGDVIQINAPEFDPDIDGGPPTKEHREIQGSDSSIQHLLRESKKNEAPALPQQVAEEVDWLDAVPVEIPPQPTQDNDHNITNIGKNGCKFTEIIFVCLANQLGIIPVIPTQFEGGSNSIPLVEFDRA